MPASEHDFVVTLSGVTELGSDIMDALFVAGCDDATVGVRGGVVRLAFTRTAESLEEAILAAIRDIGRARIGAGVRSVEADEVQLNSGTVSAINIALDFARQRREQPGLVDETIRVIGELEAA